MSNFERVEPLQLLPNRLGVADFSSEEVEQILGPDAEFQELARDNFNWLGAYLVEEVGLHESEVVEWFRSTARGLGDKKPLETWNNQDGFTEVFSYVKAYKQMTEEALADEGIQESDPLVRSHDIARSALDVILRGFQLVGVDLRPGANPDYTRSRAIWNPDKNDGPIVRWKGNRQMEDYRITIPDGVRRATYYIVRYFPPDEQPIIMQSGVAKSFKGESRLSSSDSDIDGRPPSAGEVASFVIPVANEIKNRTFAAIAQ